VAQLSLDRLCFLFIRSLLSVLRSLRPHRMGSKLQNWDLELLAHGNAP